MKTATYNDQQNQLWIYLAICWWIGSLFAWMSSWIDGELNPMLDSSLTFSALLVVSASLALRLPVLTPQPKTSSMEDHFVWILCLTANVNWFGYFGLKCSAFSAITPAIVIGVLAEIWLWSQAAKNDCVGSFRCWAREALQKSVRYFSIGFSPLKDSRSEVQTDAVDTSQEESSPLNAGFVKPPVSNEAACADEDSTPALSSLQQSVLEDETQMNQVRSTMEDGVDPTGRRYLAGEIVIQWQPDQRTQYLVVGFVPAFTGLPEVDFELDSLDCSAQVVNCTPVGLRFQLRRSQAGSQSEGVLSWYAREAESGQEGSPNSAESQPQTLA
ncbi:MAG: hypothetical protein U0930_15385 [Pirellulales bacterium]